MSSINTPFSSCSFFDEKSFFDVEIGGAFSPLFFFQPVMVHDFLTGIGCF